MGTSSYPEARRRPVPDRSSHLPTDVG